MGNIWIGRWPYVTQGGGAEVLYTDLASAPIGAFVTLYKDDDTTEVVVFNGSNAPGVATHTGRIIEVTPSTIVAAVASWQAGDVFYLRGGTYSGVIRSDSWNFQSNFDLHSSTPGTVSQPIAFVGYPGETATLTGAGGYANFSLEGAAPSAPKYITIAKLNLIAAGSNITGGGAGAPDGASASGPKGIRVVGNTLTITDNTSNTMTGMLVFSGDDCIALGNTFNNPADRVIYNNNHAIYVILGVSNIEIAYNRLVNLRLGHVIQIHTDGTPRPFTNISVHDNYLEAADSGDMRGVTVSNVDETSTISVVTNEFRNLGQDFSAVAVYAGHVDITDNRFYGIQGPNIALISGVSEARDVNATGNRFNNVSGTLISVSTSWDDIVLNGNRYCGVTAPAQELNPLACGE